MWHLQAKKIQHCIYNKPLFIRFKLNPLTMLVEAMNPVEIATQVYREYSKIYFTTAQRLLKEYDRERRKLKIDKSRIYTRHYTIKTAQKNNWIIFIGKAPSKEKYKGMECANTCCMVYYYTSKGFRVLVPV